MQRAVLRRKDLPAGWTAKPASTTGSADPTFNKNLDDCLGLPPAVESYNSPKAQANDFERTSATSRSLISNTIIAGTKKGLDAQQYSALLQPKAAGCINQFFGASLQKSVSAGSNGVALTGINTTVLPVGRFLDQTVAFHLSATLSAAGTHTVAQSVNPDQPATQVPVAVDFVFVKQGRYIGEFGFTTIGAPFDTTLEHHVISTVARRMKSLPKN